MAYFPNGKKSDIRKTVGLTSRQPGSSFKSCGKPESLLVAKERVSMRVVPINHPAGFSACMANYLPFKVAPQIAAYADSP
jgi:hypothetical protein